MPKSTLKKALIIGILCIATYLINYYLRNMLSVLSPQLYETQLFNATQVGLLSSVYMILYAAGQLKADIPICRVTDGTEIIV